MRRCLIILLLCCLGIAHVSGQGELPAGETTPITLTVDGIERTAFVHMPPANQNDEPTPAVIALHGLQWSPRAFEAITGLSDAADERGFIAVYPASLSGFWDDGRSAVGYGTDIPVNDVGFLSALA